MEIVGTACCAVMELDYIQDEKTPPDVLSSVCRQIEDEQSLGSYDYQLGRYIRKPVSALKPSAFYTFTGVERVKKPAVPPSINRGTERTGYGKKFANYIKKHRLGVLVESPVRANRVNHPDHFVKVWVWAPSEKALNKWWRKHKVDRAEDNY